MVRQGTEVNVIVVNKSYVSLILVSFMVTVSQTGSVSKVVFAKRNMADLINDTKLLLFKPLHAFERLWHIYLLFAVPLPIITCVDEDKLNGVNVAVDS